MNLLFRSTLTLLTIASAQNMYAQQFEKMIPKDAPVVLKVNADDWMRKNTVASNNDYYYKIYGEFLDDYRWKDFEKHGINLRNQNAAYILSNDSLQTFNLFLKISDAAAFDAFMDAKYEDIVTDAQGMKYLYVEDGIWYWGNGFLRIIKGRIIPEYYAAKKEYAHFDLKTLSRYGEEYYKLRFEYEDKIENGIIKLPEGPYTDYEDYKSYSYEVKIKPSYLEDEINYREENETIEFSEYDSAAAVAVVTIDEDEQEVSVATAVEPPKEVIIDKEELIAVSPSKDKKFNGIKSKDAVYPNTAEPIAMPVIEEDEFDEVTAIEEAAERTGRYTSYNYSSYLADSVLNEKEYINDSLVSLVSREVFYREASTVLKDGNTILDNKTYVKNISNDAVGSAYFNTNILLQTAYGSYFWGWGRNNFIQNNKDAEYVILNTFLKEDKINTKYTMLPNEKNRDLYKKVYKRKLNKQLFNYIDQKNDIAFVTHSINTENYLKALPEQMKQVKIGRDKDNELYQVIIDIAAFLIDEEAIGKAVKGDGMFVFRGFSPKEYTYVTYDYDEESEDYEMIEKEETKHETMPDFLYMYSYDDAKLTRKILNYLSKSEYGAVNNGIYTFKDFGYNSSPYSLHVLVKDGIVFLGTNLDDINAISLNKYQKDISCSTKRKMRKNAVYGYFNPDNAINKYQSDDIEIDSKVNNVFQNLGVTEVKMKKMKCKKIEGTWDQYIPNEYSNSATYLGEMVNKWFKIVKW